MNSVHENPVMENPSDPMGQRGSTTHNNKLKYQLIE